MEEALLLGAEIEALKGRVEAAEPAGKRQAAPFSQCAPKQKPKKPG